MDPREIVTGEVRPHCLVTSVKHNWFTVAYSHGSTQRYTCLNVLERDHLVSRPMWGDQ